MLANSYGHDLLTHLKACANVAKEMAIYLGLSEDLIKRAYSAGLLHDIAKAISLFQKHIKGIITDPLSLNEDSFQDAITGNPLHHEIGWAYLTTKMSDDKILSTIYWHHAKPIHPNDKKRKIYMDADEITALLSVADKKALEKIWEALLPLLPFDVIGTPQDRSIETPKLFIRDGSKNRDHNAESMLLRACVISADRHISSLDTSTINNLAINQNLVSEEVRALLLGSIPGEIIKPKSYDQERYNLQLDIIKDIGESQTSIVKAPAGLGKTLIGLLWSKKCKGKVLWVCPRNAVATAVYENIINEINATGLSCSIELYLTGKRQQTNIENNRPEFNSDIIVTNIDALMSPMISNHIAGRLFTVYGAHVVLDEFHEFVSDAPLFAAFITYMRARHRLSNRKTLLLSATPSIAQELWDKEDKKTLILPNNQMHYPPQHKGKYLVNFINSFPAKATPGTLLVCNSVSEAQKNFKEGGYTDIIHHCFTEKDRKVIDEKIKILFGKKSKWIDKEKSLSAAIVVQAAMDISFKDLYDSVCSPESSLQRIGRTDRWGTFQKEIPTINFFNASFEKTEGGAIGVVYNRYLQKIWFDFLKSSLIDCKYVNLDRIYKIYNSFQKKYRKEILKYLIDQYDIGMNGINDRGTSALISFEPLKLLLTDQEKKKD